MIESLFSLERLKIWRFPRENVQTGRAQDYPIIDPIHGPAYDKAVIKKDKALKRESPR